MNLLLVSLLSLLAWRFFGKITIPWIKKRPFSKSQFSVAAKAGWISIMAYIQKFFLLAAVVYGAIWLFLAIMNVIAKVFSGSERIVSGFFSFLITFNQWIDGVNASKALPVLIILSIIFIVLIVRNAQHYALSVYSKLSKDYDEGKLANLENTPEMDEVDQQLAKAREEWNRFRSMPIDMDVPGNMAMHNEFSDRLTKLISSLEARRKELVAKRKEPEINSRVMAEMEKGAKEKKPAGSSWKERLLIFFTSQGLVKTIYNTSKSLGTVGLAMVFLSFLVASKSAISSDALKVAQEIASLELAAKQKELDDNWRKGLDQDIPQEDEEVADDAADWTDEDEEALDYIAQEFEEAIADQFAVEVGPVDPITAFRFRANAIKEHVIRTFAYHNGQLRAGFEVAEQGARMPNGSADQAFSKKYSKTYSEKVNKKGPSTLHGKEFREKLEKKVKSNKSVLQKFRSSYRAAMKSFTTPATPKDVLGMIFSQSIDGMMEGIIPEGDIESKIAKDFLNKTGEKAYKAWVEVKMSQFTDDLIHRSYGEAVENVAKATKPAEKFVAYAMQDMEFPPVEKIADDLFRYPPAVDHQPLTPTQVNNTKTAIKNLANSVPEAKPSVFAEALTDFKYYFPGQPGMDLESAAAELLTPPRGGPDKPRPVAPGTSTPNVRARNFTALKGFRRIGGVLIGQEPSNSGQTGVNFNDISWTDLGNQMEIFLHRADGQVISAGIYDKDIVHQALVYVADGRLITVTMVTGKPLPFLKILPHPALTDTDLGCKAIGLDRLVDKYAGPDNDPIIEKALSSFQYQNLLYTYACLKAAANKSVNNQYLLAGYITEMEIKIQAAWGKIYTSLDGGEVLYDRAQSHLFSKPEYYDNQIVQVIRLSLKGSGGDLESFLNSMENARADGDLESLLKVESEQWSGVRELPYKIDPGLSFLKPRPSDNADLYPLSFIRQIVFNPTNFSEDDSYTEQIDEEPWEFPTLKIKGAIENMVWEGVQSNAADMLVLERMKSFTLMQRVFRAAMNGDFGLEFPVEKLAALATATRAYVQNVPTPTWNSSGMSWSDLSYQLSELTAEQREAYYLLWTSQDVENVKNKRPCN